MTAKETKQLDKAYTKAFNSLQKNIFTKKDSGLLLFTEYLKYLRDSIILNNYNRTSESSKLKLATIITAIAEFDAYVLEQNSQQKYFHWSSFCELIKQNMEDWLNIDDSV